MAQKTLRQPSEAREFTSGIIADAMVHLLARDLDHILGHTAGLWEELRDSAVFITGGTGFFGTWLIESLVWANERLALGCSATVLTRDAGAFRRKVPHLAANPALRFHEGDVRSFPFPEGEFSHVVHAATQASVQLNQQEPLVMLDTIVTGTRHALDFALKCGASKFLLTSSGAVYGRQPPDLSHVPENHLGAPDPGHPASAYGEGKRLAELLCSLYQLNFGLQTKIARCFAFVGPHLPLDTHFAIGNFIHDLLGGGGINVRGDGTSFRSYLYAADLMIWLWTILFRGEAGRPYNVGSDRALTIAELARKVAELETPPAAVRIAEPAEPGKPAERYVPCIARARGELGLKEWITLDEAVRRTRDWHLIEDGR